MYHLVCVVKIFLSIIYDHKCVITIMWLYLVRFPGPHFQVSLTSLCWFFIAFSFCISSFSLFLYLYLYCIGIVTHKKRYDAPHVAWVLYSFITSLHAMITMMIFRLVWFDYCYHHVSCFSWKFIFLYIFSRWKHLVSTASDISVLSLYLLIYLLIFCMYFFSLFYSFFINMNIKKWNYKIMKPCHQNLHLIDCLQGNAILSALHLRWVQLLIC